MIYVFYITCPKVNTKLLLIVYTSIYMFITYIYAVQVLIIILKTFQWIVSIKKKILKWTFTIHNIYQVFIKFTSMH